MTRLYEGRRDRYNGSFNGAAARGLRMTAGRGGGGARDRRRFNGAAARGLRMTTPYPVFYRRECPLQWGRSPRAADDGDGHRWRHLRLLASMGPQPAGCG